MDRDTTILPPLQRGQRLDQRTFHERYLAMPDDQLFELIGGVVCIPESGTLSHSRMRSLCLVSLMNYAEATPGVECLGPITLILGPEQEPQPDVTLRLLPNSGGQTTEEDEYLVGALELVLEVASSSEAIDLHAKKADYERYGVKEYLVISLCPKKFYAFLLRENKFVEPPASPDGIYRSTVFPGLWIDPTAFLTGDQNRVREVLAAGLASPEHTAFVERLAAYCSEHPS